MIKKIISVAFVIFLTVMLYEALDQINRHDLSIQKSTTCNLKEKGPIYLITYGDGEAYIANTKALAESALNNCIDVIYMYRKDHLDKEFVEKNKKILSAKRGAGYWLWKPYITLKTLKQIPEGAIMLYLDSAFKIVRPLDNFINEINGYDILLVDNPPHLNKTYIKRDLFKIMNMDNDSARNAEQLSAGMFVMRNTENSRAFVKKWLDISQIDGAISDDPSADEYPEFIAHRHDQSILSLLYLKDKRNIKVTHIYDLLDNIYLHRRRGVNESLFLLDYTAKDWPSMREYVMRLPFLEKALYLLLRTERTYSFTE
jgi:hypothetical protein